MGREKRREKKGEREARKKAKWGQEKKKEEKQISRGLRASYSKGLLSFSTKI